jgi:hypothetical protein
MEADMTATPDPVTAGGKALLDGPGRAPNPSAATISTVAKVHGTGPFKQFREILVQSRGVGKMTAQEYYANRVFRSDLSATVKRQYIGEKGSKKLNDRLSPRGFFSKRAFIRDKVIYAEMMRALGFPITETQAIVSTDRTLGDKPSLRSADDIETFLRSSARYPIFVKPEEGSGSVGSALIMSLDRKAELLTLGTGRKVDVAAFSKEAFADYGHGLILQTAIEQHPDVRSIIGNCVGTVRVVTVIEDNEPRVLYALWKLPSPTAMSDNYWQDGSIIGAIDHSTGEITRVQRGTGINMEVLENHPVSGKQLRGWQIPNWEAMIDTALRGHKVMPEFGVFGWDVAIGPDGPIIVECNANPHHMLYQLAFDAPVLNPEFSAVFDRIAARTEKWTAKTIANAKAFEKRRKG